MAGRAVPIAPVHVISPSYWYASIKSARPSTFFGFATGACSVCLPVCDICCKLLGICYRDTNQVEHMLMYLIACMINVFLDMFVICMTAYKVMVGQEPPTYLGERLADIKSFAEPFQTYMTQQSLGGSVYACAGLATFFLCFVLLHVTIMISYQIGKVIIRTHKEIRGRSTSYVYIYKFICIYT